MASIKRNDILNSIDYCNKKKLFNKLNKVYNELPSGNCAGCGNCCMESVGINLVEFINIYKYLKNNEDLRKKCLDKVLDYYFLEFIEKKPCPFKDENNRCLIYEVRPLNCRLFGHWKKDDYNKNLLNVTKRNLEYGNLMKSEHEFNINEEVVNYRIKYCDDFIPENDYLNKSERLSFSDEIMIIDSSILSKEIIDIDFKDRGIVEYFIESLLDEELAYKIKIKVSKDEKIRNRAISRLKRILL